MLPGSRIEISAPEFPEGTHVEILVLASTIPTAARRSILEIIESLQGHRLHQTPEQVRRHLQEERNAWDR